MAITLEKIKELQKILLEEYGTSLPESEIISEAVRLSEFAKTVVKSIISKD